MSLFLAISLTLQRCPMNISAIWESGEVFVDGKLLSPKPSQKVINHSPDGFMWGYGGSGPAQLALALLLLVTDRDTAVRLHQRFKFDYIAKWPQTDIDCKIDIKAYVTKQGGTISTQGMEDALFLDEVFSFPSSKTPGVCSKGWATRCAKSTGKTCKCACGGSNHKKFSQLYLFGEEEKSTFVTQ